MIWELRIEHMSTRRIKPKYVTKYGRRIKIKTRIKSDSMPSTVSVFVRNEILQLSI